MKTTDLSCCDLEALPIGANVVPLDQPQGAVMIITDTRTDGTSFYHTAAWLDESGRCSYAEYERSDLSAVKTNGAVAPSFTLAAMMAGR